MALNQHQGLEISEDLNEAIRSFPVRREVEHCGAPLPFPPSLSMLTVRTAAPASKSGRSRASPRS